MKCGIQNIKIRDIFLWPALILMHVTEMLGGYSMYGLKRMICLYALVAICLLLLLKVTKDGLRSSEWYFLLCAVIGTVFGYLNGGSVNAIIYDLVTILQFVFAYELLKENPDHITKFFKLITLFSIVLAVYTIIVNPEQIEIDTLAERRSVWDTTFFLMTLFWMTTFFFIIRIVTGKGGWLPVAGLLMAVFVSTLFLKRQIYFELAILILVLVLYKSWIQRKWLFSSILKIALATAVLGGAVFIIVQYGIKFDLLTLINRVIERFGESQETGFVRFEESINYLKTANLIDILFGRGYGVVHGGLGFNNTALHIGFPNLILKNGLLFSLFYLWMLCRLFAKLVKRNFDSDWEIACCLYALTTLPSMFLLSNFWSTTPSYGFMLYSILYCILPKEVNGQPVAATDLSEQMDEREGISE